MVFLKRFKEFAPVVSIVIILFGLLNQMFFYSHFGIEIQHYLTVSELILSACNQLLAIIILTLFHAIITHIFALDANQRGVAALEGRMSTNRWKIFRGEIIGFFFNILYILFLVLNKYDKFLYIGAISMAICLIYPIIIFETKLRFQRLGKPFYAQDFNAIMLSILLVFLLFTVTLIDIDRSEKGRYLGTVIKTKDSTYVSDSSHFFIGKTEKFWFIKNRTTKSTVVIPDAEIIKSEIHDK